MNEHGFSLAEMVVGLGIVAILLAVGTLKFRDYLRRYQVESQTRSIQADLVQARTAAIYQRRPVRVKVYATRLETYSTATDRDGGAEPVAVRPLAFPVAGGQPHYDFNERGVTFDLGAICTAGEGAAVDSVAIENIRITVGKRNPGEECSGPNVLQ